MRINQAEIQFHITHRYVGGGLSGYVDSPYSKLRERLGRPQTACKVFGDGKSNVIWQLQFTSPIDATAIIYDYKADLPPGKVRRWHIGGCSRQVVELIGYILDQPVETLPEPRGLPF